MGEDINHNCDTCDHKRNNNDEWCYMFEHKPEFKCKIHTEEINKNKQAEDARHALNRWST